MARAQNNKRSLERRNLIYFPKVLLQGSDEEFGRMVDVTQEGFMLIRYNAVNSGEIFKLRISWMTENSKEEEWDCTATACWCKPDKNPELYAIGFKFNDKTKSTNDEITRLIRKWSFPEW